MEFTWLFIKS